MRSRISENLDREAQNSLSLFQVFVCCDESLLTMSCYNKIELQKSNQSTMIEKKSNPESQPLSKRLFSRIIESKGINKLPFNQYRDKIQNHYDGPAGAVLAFASLLSLHEPLIGQLLKSKKYDVSEKKSLLDVGSGAGQILKFLLKETSSDANIVGFDLSQQMLKRASHRVKSDRPKFVAGDVMHLPFADNSFDSITCGWVLEYLPDPAPGLMEMERVLKPNGTILILATEDTLTGAMNSRTWKCRTYNRKEFQESWEQSGLNWDEELWFTPVHRFFKLGGILVKMTRKADSEPAPEPEPAAEMNNSHA